MADQARGARLIPTRYARRKISFNRPNASANRSRHSTDNSGEVWARASRIARAALLCPSPKPAVRMRIFFTTETARGSLMDNCAGQSTLGRDEDVAADWAHRAEDGVGDGDGQHHRFGCADGLSTSFHSRPWASFSLALARVVRDRSSQIASHVCHPETIFAAGSEGAGHS